MGQPLGGVAVRGQYRNLAGYAYRVTIPPGVAAYRDPAPAPAHGFAIDLGPTADDRISVDGSYNAAEYPDARYAVGTIVDWIKDKAGVVEETQFHSSTLGGLPAMEVVVKYRDKRGNAARVCRSLAAIRRIRPTDTMGIIYEIILDTSAERLDQHNLVYEAVVKSFRLDPLSRY
jgi:hypothetical protein